jgi:hypothetical protein
MLSIQAGLERAKIIGVQTPDVVCNCMFNPHELTLVKQNAYDSGDTKGSNVPKVKFQQGGAESLTLQLFFDTYAEDSDVRIHTAPLWQLMMVTDARKNPDTDKSEPTQVLFQWGIFIFKAVITSLSQKFTLFNKDGVPLRTTVDVTFQQAEDEQKHHRQNPTSGGGPPMRVSTMQAGDRLDLLAHRVYGDPSHWRLIARANGVRHPLRLREGQVLIIPTLE